MKCLFNDRFPTDKVKKKFRRDGSKRKNPIVLYQDLIESDRHHNAKLMSY